MGLEHAKQAAQALAQRKQEVAEVRRARALAYSIDDIREAAAVVMETMRGDDKALAYKAAVEVLDRGLGKAHQTTSTHITHSAADLSDEEIEERAWKILQARRKKSSK